MTTSAPKLGWGHININVRDLEQSVAFYRKLGFDIFIPAIPYLALEQGEAKPLPEDAAAALGVPSGTKGRACIMQLDDGFPKLDLTELETPEPRAPLRNQDVGCVRVCLITEDLPATVARLKSEGVTFLSEPKVGHAELADVAVCKDPDGTLIELLQVYLERWQAILEPQA